MITTELHRQPVALDRNQHRQTRLRLPVTDWSPAAGLNSLFVAAAECSHVARDYPVVFVRTGQDDKGEIDYAPIAVLGLSKGENLYLDGGRWRVAQLPALLALYPFCVARIGGDRYAVCLDESWSGVAGEGEGERLFGDDAEPTGFTKKMQGELERMEAQVEQTRAVGRRLAALDLLRERRFEATLPGGRKLAVDGFFMVDEDRVKALPDATVLELHREGLLAVIHAHWISLGHLKRLLQWRIERDAPAA